MKRLLLALPFLLPVSAFAAEPIVVRNFDQPAWDNTRGIELTENLRIGGVDDDSVVFGQMVTIAVNSKGEIITADYKQNLVQRFDATGNLIGPIGHVGDGPGEYRFVVAVSVDAKDNIYVAGGHRISIFDATGKFASDFREISDSYPRSIRVLPDGALIVSEFDRQSNTTLQRYVNGKHSQHFVAAFKPTGPYPFEAQNFAAAGFIDIGPDGNIYYSQMVPYEIQKLTPAGVPLMRILRENDFVKEPVIEKKGGGMSFSGLSGSSGIFVLPDGRILNIISVPGDGDKMSTVIDVFDTEGHLLISKRLNQSLVLRWMDVAGNAYAFDRDGLAVVRYNVAIH
jgi:hypothetical protein